MILKIDRRITNRLYTIGELYVDGRIAMHTLEYTPTMLATGDYPVEVSKRQALHIGPMKRNVTPFRIEPGTSYITCRRNKSIGVGTNLIHGALMEGPKLYTRLTDRVKTALAQGEPLELHIEDSQAETIGPIIHWLTPASKRRKR